MPVQGSAAPTQWEDSFESDAEGEAAMQAMELMDSAFHSISSRDAAVAAPWPPVLSVSGEYRSHDLHVQARPTIAAAPRPLKKN